MVREVVQTPDLLKWLLEQNYRSRFGALSLDGDGNIVLRHGLVGDTLTNPEMRIVVAVLVELADELNDKIIEQFGGSRAHGWTQR